MCVKAANEGTAHNEPQVKETVVQVTLITEISLWSKVVSGTEW